VVIGEHDIQIDGQPRHITHEQIDRRAALERERAIAEDEGSDLLPRVLRWKAGIRVWP
jgi:hypothetical protein